MANKYQESILQAIDYLVNNRIDKINKDQTITGTIANCDNALTQQYSVNYNGGLITAYAQEGASYKQNQEVYILVPEGDFSKRKVILGKASQVTEDDNITFVSSLLNNYNMIGQNVIKDNNNNLPQGLHSYLAKEYILLYQRGDTEHSLVSINEDEFKNYIKDAEALLIEASFQTRLPRAHRIAKNGLYGIQYVLAFKDQADPAQIKYVSYVLDSNQMTGNPLLYNNYTDQYAIFPIDTENFLYIDSIMIYEQGFVEEDDTIQADFWGADIFVKDVEIYGLREITATNGEYTLRLSTPDGATFKTLTTNESLYAYGIVTHQNTTDVSDSTTYYWFTKDDRITSASEEYQIYGGSGWKYLKDKGNNRTFTTTGYENRAYENKYLVAAVYKEQVILKQEFTFYNEAARRDIEITSDLGLQFSFDRGTPTLTCLVNGKSSDFEDNHADELFSFSWAKIDAYGNTTPISISYEELEEQYNQLVEEGASYSDISAIRNQMIAMEGVEFDRNILKYPIKQIDSSATFSCSVFLRENPTAEEFFIGSAMITLQNESVASPTDYYILIENGDQVFQYSESGVSPSSDRYQDPLEVRPLECHFFDPAGLEVDSDTYSVKWKVPLEDTLIVTPAQGMVINPANDRIEWFDQAVYPLDIEESYDYQALNNQVTCIVTYAGVEYQRDSNLLFTKIGENGTNGTDVVCKISPIAEPNKGLLAIELMNAANPKWNNGQGIAAQALKFQGYKRNELMNLETISWSISGGNSRYMSCDNGIVTWDDSKTGYRNQIVKGQTLVEGQTYYAFYPIPVIDYAANTRYKIILDKTKTLKSITYNADGRNPLYNKNQGVFFTLSTDDVTKYIVWDTFGGQTEDNASSALNLAEEKNARDGSKNLRLGANSDREYGVYIIPEDIYDGAWCNNIVRARIYTNQTVANQGGNPEATIYMPIYMSLNTFGLASLNAWDGNHVEINEDENYILAPQIGAGSKDNNNRFTGVVMGTAQTYDQDDPVVGLLGYSHGKQSIWLDSETGNAIFGLPEDQASTNNQYTEGRIELIPGGDSKIGMWTIGSRAIYNMTEPSLDDTYKQVEPDGPYPDYEVPGAQISIPHTAQGMILNANPAYLSVKGMPLNRSNSNIDWEGANTALRIGDSLEVELDPRKSSVFSIYRHTMYEDGELTDSWHRYPLVGINANGQFYTNAIEDGESSMGIGKVGAFGYQAADGKYVGAQFAYSGGGIKPYNIFKFFIEDTGTTSGLGDRTLYLTAGTDIGNEYARPIQIHADRFAVYTSTTNSSSLITDHRITLNNDVLVMGHGTDNYMQIPSTTSGQSFIQSTNRPVSINWSGSSAAIKNSNGLSLTTKTLNTTINSGSSSAQALTMTITGDATIQNFRNLKITSSASSTAANNFKLTMLNSTNTSNNLTDSQMLLGSSNANIELNNSTSSWIKTKGLEIQSTSRRIHIVSSKVADGIVIEAIPTNGQSTQGVRLSMVPQDGGNSDFILTSPNGTVQSKANLGNNRAGIQITNGMATPWGYFTGTISGSTNSIVANRDIRSNNGWMYGGNFSFLASKSWNAHGGTYNSTSLEQHLAWLYSLVNGAYNRADAAYNRADAAYNRAQSYYDSHIGSSLYGYATQAWVNGRGYITQATYNSHQHRFSYTKTTVDGKEVVLSIGTSGGSYNTVTTAPV